VITVEPTRVLIDTGSGTWTDIAEHVTEIAVEQTADEAEVASVEPCPVLRTIMQSFSYRMSRLEAKHLRKWLKALRKRLRALPRYRRLRRMHTAYRAKRRHW
jgi:hypothetical protein